jgi:hypothetical protein
MSRIVKFLAQATGLLPSDIRAIINQAPVSYKRYTIPKRKGGRRPIAQPAREVKKLQRLLVARLHALPIHDAAMAYREGISIRDNAERHCRNGPIMKFDFSNFFTSIRDRDWQAYCSKYGVFGDSEDIELSSRLFFMKTPGSTILRLAIGAPSSPWLSNVLMYDFDEAVTQVVLKDKVTYTRYADDLTFSARRTGFLNHVSSDLRKIISELRTPKLILNEGKTVVATTKYRRVVTGLTLANDGRVTIGRERKREIRAALHNASQGKLDPEACGRLAGLLAFIKDVEPEHYRQITMLYGADVIAKLQTAR